MFSINEKEFYIENAVEMNKRYPKTFFIPSQEDIDKLKAGDCVKLIFVLKIRKKGDFYAERMWVQILTIHNGIFIGTLDNKPFCLKSIKHDDIVSFRAENIACIE